MRLGWQAGFVMFLTLCQCFFEIQRANSPALGETKRQVKQRNENFAGAFAFAWIRTLIPVFGFATKAAVFGNLDHRLRTCQRPCIS